MKLALISDTHYGARSDNISILDYQKSFFDNIFFPYLISNNIDTIVNLGDLVDRRKYINVYTANRMRKDFLEKIAENNMIMHIIPGNHDTYFRDTIKVNSLEALLSDIPNIKIYMHPTEIMFGNTEILLIPWICEENRKECLDAIKNTKAQVAFGHLELQGFEMHSGRFCEHGDDVKVFDKFDIVCSGHFHHKSTYQNINYLGNPFELTWSDYGDIKGFHVFDTDTRELEYIPNKFKLFQKIHYSDEEKKYNEVMNVDFNKYKNSYVKVIVHEKTNLFWYDKFISKLEEAGPIDIKAVDDHLNLDISDLDIVDQSKSTIDIMIETVKNISMTEEKENQLISLLNSLYNESSSVV